MHVRRGIVCMSGVASFFFSFSFFALSAWSSLQSCWRLVDGSSQLYGEHVIARLSFHFFLSFILRGPALTIPWSIEDCNADCSWQVRVRCNPLHRLCIDDASMLARNRSPVLGPKHPPSVDVHIPNRRTGTARSHVLYRKAESHQVLTGKRIKARAPCKRETVTRARFLHGRWWRQLHTQTPALLPLGARGEARGSIGRLAYLASRSER